MPITHTEVQKKIYVSWKVIIDIRGKGSFFKPKGRICPAVKKSLVPSRRHLGRIYPLFSVQKYKKLPIATIHLLMKGRGFPLFWRFQMSLSCFLESKGKKTVCLFRLIPPEKSNFAQVWIETFRKMSVEVKPMEQRAQRPNRRQTESNIKLWSSERRSQTCLDYAESWQSKAKPSLLEYCRGAKEEDEVNLFGLCRVATEEDEVNMCWTMPSVRGRRSQTNVSLSERRSQTCLDYAERKKRTKVALPRLQYQTFHASLPLCVTLYSARGGK